MATKTPGDRKRAAEGISKFTNPAKEVFMNDWCEHLCIELTYMKELYLPVLLAAHRRLEGLIFKGQVLADKLGSLKCFLENSLELFSLQKANIACANKKHCRRLVQMTKLFVMGALIKDYEHRNEETAWPLENLCAISELLQQINMKSISYQVGPALKYEDGDGLSEGDWHHQAYKELISTRNLSLKLDEAYISRVYRGRLCDLLVRAFDEFLEKSLEFLATSKAEMVSLSKDKCYYRMMLVKLFVVLTNDSVSTKQNTLQQQNTGSLPRTSEFQTKSRLVLCRCETASSNLVGHNQLEISPNWRDWIYEELREIRKKYSSDLDEAYRVARGLVPTQNPDLVKKRKVSNNILLENFLSFLGYARADLALLSKEECLDRMMRIREYLNFPKKFVSAEQYENFLESSCHSTYENQPVSLPYWRDEAYEEIRSRKAKFLYEVDVLCNEVHKLTFQIPHLATVSNELKLFRDRPCFVFTMTRPEIALFSEEEFDELLVLVNRDLMKVKDILTRLQPVIGGRTGFSCDIRPILKERNKAFESVACGN